MINATSPAAKFSPIQTDAINASDTRTSALMSNAVTRPIIASKIIGTPQSIMETHAISKGRCTIFVKLKINAIPERISNIISFFVPSSSSSFSSFFIEFLIRASSYTLWGMGYQEV